MRKLVVHAFNISLDGVNAQNGTGYFDFCMSGIDPAVPADVNHLAPDESQLDATGDLQHHIEQQDPLAGVPAAPLTRLSSSQPASL